MKPHIERSKNFACSVCGHMPMHGAMEYACTHCGPAGILEPTSLPLIAREDDPFTDSPGMWRYERLLALSLDAPRPPIPVGGTPLMHAGRLAERLGLPNLYIKNDSLNPSGSLKDRATAVALARAAELGVDRVAVASTGNAGSSLACLAAAMGLSAAVFVPEAAPRAKLVQALLYGADVFAVEGSYDDAFELCLQACTHFGWYNRNTAYNPFTLEGKKTVSFEMYDQLGFRAPDVVLVPTGDGCILSGVARGFRDLHDLGLIQAVPRLIAVQAEGSNAIALALARTDGAVTPIHAHSVADSITVDLPRNGPMAVRDVRRSGGRAVVVSDSAILTAQRELASTSGIFAEPAAAASLAGLKLLMEEEPLPREAAVVLLVTGSGLKDIDSASRSAPAPYSVAPSLDALRALVPA